MTRLNPPVVMADWRSQDAATLANARLTRSQGHWNAAAEWCRQRPELCTESGEADPLALSCVLRIRDARGPGSVTTGLVLEWMAAEELLWTEPTGEAFSPEAPNPGSTAGVGGVCTDA